MILKLGKKHQTMELYKVCINHDHGMTLTFLQQGQLRLPMHLNGTKLENVNKWQKKKKKNLLGMSKWTEDLCL